MKWAFRIVAGVLFAFGGWTVGAGLRGNDAVVFQGLSMIVGGLIVETIAFFLGFGRTRGDRSANTTASEDDPLDAAALARRS